MDCTSKVFFQHHHNTPKALHNGYSHTFIHQWVHFKFKMSSLCLFTHRNLLPVKRKWDWMTRATFPRRRARYPQVSPWSHLHLMSLWAGDTYPIPHKTIMKTWRVERQIGTVTSSETHCGCAAADGHCNNWLLQPNPPSLDLLPTAKSCLAAKWAAISEPWVAEGPT